jgi:hypothetical protein
MAKAEWSFSPLESSKKILFSIFLSHKTWTTNFNQEATFQLESWIGSAPPGSTVPARTVVNEPLVYSCFRRD